MKKLLLGLVILGITLQSCSNKTCNAYGSKWKPVKEAKKQGRCYF